MPFGAYPRICFHRNGGDVTLSEGDGTKLISKFVQSARNFVCLDAAWLGNPGSIM